MFAAILAVVVLSVAVVGLTLVVYRDGTRLGMERPARWAVVVFATTGVGAALLVLTDLPAAAVVVVAIVGPVVYLFEREDAVYGDGSSDEFTLPHGTDRGETGSGDEPDDG